MRVLRTEEEKKKRSQPISFTTNRRGRPTNALVVVQKELLYSGRVHALYVYLNVGDLNILLLSLSRIYFFILSRVFYGES
jgi:hypothetical protein